mmetsp:Transcript_27866/g.44636  ORF Transcript_27866/g.44636 Transcript_27866/m.44636 type:complete len:634 (-) Transcript_27866:1905-3806(-)|eukprot:CAMPEP_0203750952 /NCGR_PEP_ID=MMETSP0098-20131031/5106_1 /ASSEMBLY_ACC=CAM_ASM_000208 /TAXON_ID=96639 /ORGANISM=" , Strain NY0313808BC1" /LENGTH=633 /DNA_ID=CAMNT_0050640463 /DNA_START=1373 /DNA_END=3274 /DNA_ORIENTATION=-
MVRRGFILVAVFGSAIAQLRSGTEQFQTQRAQTSFAEVKHTSTNDYKNTQFSHGKKVYDTHHPVFKLFGNFESWFGLVWKSQTFAVELENSTRYVSHHMIPMRDGVRLSTIVVLPFSLHSEEKRAAMLSRSPYGPTSDQLASLFMASLGHVAIIQDQRGTFLSEGVFSMWRHDGEDGYDTMKWISEQPWSNGEVFSSGISADGCGAFTQIVQAPKWLKGQFLVFASASAHETIYPGGAFRAGLIEGWMTAMSIMTKGKSLTHTLPDILNHEPLSSYYKNIEAKNWFQNVKWPTVHLTGWWDIFAGHQLNAFDGIVKHGDRSMQLRHAIFVGKLGHCALFRLPLPHSPDSKGFVNAFGYSVEAFSNNLQGPFHQRLKQINFFVQGPEYQDGLPQVGNYWTSVDEWPESKPTSFFFSSNKTLVRDVDLVQPGVAEYIYSPHHPLATKGGNNLLIEFTGNGCGPADQSHLEKRHDIALFTSEALEQPLAVTGRITATMFVSSNREDTDFTVSLNDLYPDGYHRSMQVRYGIRRMRWRDGAETPSPPMDSGHIYKIEVDLWPTSYIFNTGHRLRVMVSSSNAPYNKPNSNIEEDAKYQHPILEGKKANNSIHFSKAHPSFITLPVVDMHVLNPNINF